MAQTAIYYNVKEGTERRVLIPQEIAQRNTITINDRLKWCNGIDNDGYTEGYSRASKIPYSRYRTSHNRNRNLGTILSPSDIYDFNKFTQLSINDAMTQERGNLFFNHPVYNLKVDARENIKTFSNNILPSQLGVENAKNGLPPLEPIKGMTIIEPKKVNSEYYKRYGKY